MIGNRSGSRTSSAEAICAWCGLLRRLSPSGLAFGVRVTCGDLDVPRRRLLKMERDIDRLLAHALTLAGDQRRDCDLAVAPQA
jgi:hypothetical protein